MVDDTNGQRARNRRLSFTNPIPLPLQNVVRDVSSYWTSVARAFCLTDLLENMGVSVSKGAYRDTT